MMVCHFQQVLLLSCNSFPDSKEADNDEEESSASNLVLHPSAFIMMRLTTTPHDGLTDNDLILAADYGPDSVFDNCQMYPSDFLA